MSTDPRPIQRWALLFKLFVSAALLAVILVSIPLGDLAAGFASIEPLPAAAALMLSLVMNWLVASQTRILTDLQGMTLSAWRIFQISHITNFYGLFLPGSIAGGAIRWYKLSSRDRKPAEALATIVFSRMLTTMMAAALGSVCWLLDSRARDHPLLGLVLGAVFFGLAGCSAILFRKSSARAVAGYIERHRHIPAFARSGLVRLLHAAAGFEGLGRAQLVSMSAVLLLYHLLGIAGYWLFAIAVELPLSFVSLGWVRTCVILLVMIPITISGLGLREGGLIVMLQTYGVSPALAVTFSFLLLLRNVFCGAIGGIFELWTFLRTGEAATRRSHARSEKPPAHPS